MSEYKLENIRLYLEVLQMLERNDFELQIYMQMRGTHANFLNDTSEIKYGVRLFNV